MTFPLDLTMWRVYSAEQSLPAGQIFDSVEDAQTYLWWVQSSKWWKTTFPDAPHITVEIKGDGDRSGIRSYAHRISSGEAVVSLHPRMMHSLVLLHEVAHCIAPRSYGDIKKIRKGYVANGYHHDHGEYFRSAFSALADRFKLGVDSDELRQAYAHFELETPGLDELLAAREHSSAVDKAVAEMWEETEKRWTTDPKQIATRERIAQARAEHNTKESDDQPSGWIPPSWWGDWIWLTRRHFRPKASQERLADEVSPVVKCTARDVARLERSKTPPQNLLDLQRCVAFVAVMQVDPVWAETHKGLAAGSHSLELDELDGIAPEWVAELRHLNALLKARPPRWEVQGDR
jgi:hypothetical protein